jgi:hypothetical protein
VAGSGRRNAIAAVMAGDGVDDLWTGGEAFQERPERRPEAMPPGYASILLCGGSRSSTAQVVVGGHE